MDLTELLAIHVGILSGIIIGLHHNGVIDGITIADSLGVGYPLSDQGDMFLDGVKRAITDGIAKLETPPSGPKLVG